MEDTKSAPNYSVPALEKGLTVLELLGAGRRTALPLASL